MGWRHCIKGVRLRLWESDQKDNWKVHPPDANEVSSPSIDQQLTDLAALFRVLDHNVNDLDQKVTSLGQGAEAETAERLLTAVERIADQADQRSSWELTITPIVVNRRQG